jgi:hypothetical protein
MNADKIMRQEVKKFIDAADLNVVKMMHAMLEVDANNNWWNEMPTKVEADLNAALAESTKGKVTSHATIQKRYQKWLGNYNEELELSEAEFQKGEYITHEEMIAQIN